MDENTLSLIHEGQSTSSAPGDNHSISVDGINILKNSNSSIYDFGQWLLHVLEVLSVHKIPFQTFINRLDFVRCSDRNTSLGFKYLLKIHQNRSYGSTAITLHIANEAENVINSNTGGPICFVTPELGRWSTVGGLGVMVDELTQGGASIGQDVIVISPYYDRNRKGECNYGADDEIKFEHVRNIQVGATEGFTFGVHYGRSSEGVRYYFLHNFKVFPAVYPEGSVAETVEQITGMGKAALQLLCDLEIIPELIVTNDWFTGLTAAFGKNGSFGDTFKGTTFFHICHNGEPAYEGRGYPCPEEGCLEKIYQFDPELLVDPKWKQKIINPSRCAIICCDQWGTVSNSYKTDLLKTSPLACLLNQKAVPFGFPNGISRAKRLHVLKTKCDNNKQNCKKYIQTKYFKYNDVNADIPVYAFIGRITEQKGVLLILSVVEDGITRYDGKINILIGGQGSKSDPYCNQCIGGVNYGTDKYPFSFWANPLEFFTDGPSVNIGADFGLMPSGFEPGGIVQHEFFIAKTPVIAFRTGGGKDTVFEFEWDTNKGNGITFDHHDATALKHAIDRSMNLFKNKEKYLQCSENAFKSAIDVTDVARAWCHEFYRLRGKMYFNKADVYNDSTPGISIDMSTIHLLRTGRGVDVQERSRSVPRKHKEIEDIIKTQKQIIGKYAHGLKTSTNDSYRAGTCQEQLQPMKFTFKDSGDRCNRSGYYSVQLCGSYDKWQIRHPGNYNSKTKEWWVTLNIGKGKHRYKYIVDGEWVVNPEEETWCEDDGVINNVIGV